MGTITGTTITVPGLSNGVTYYFWYAPTIGGTESNSPGTLGSAAPSSTAFSTVAVNLQPADGALEVAPTTTVRIPFNQVLDPTTVSASTVTVTTASGTLVAVNVSVDPGNQIIVVVPQSGTWAQNTQFRVNVGTGVKNSTGTALPNSFGFTFTTLNPAGLVAWFNFDGDLSDSAGLVSSVTNNGVTFDTNTKKSGSAAAYFSGTPNYAQFGDANMSLGEEFTVTTWIYLPAISASINTIFANAGAGQSPSGFKVAINRWNTSDQRVVIEAGDGSSGGNWDTESGFVQPGAWYHLTYSISRINVLASGYNVNIFFDGQPATVSSPNSINWSIIKNTGPFYLGAMEGGSWHLGGGWGGTANGAYLDDFRIYNKVLTPAEVLNIAR